jgi:flagellar hook-associated protein 1 FlgK
MWDGWNDVANTPQVPAARSAVLQQSATVADTLNNAHAHLADEWSANRTQLSAYVDEINSAASAIAEYNETIVQAKASGRASNELEDRRDVQIMRLSELAGATASVRDNGAVDVFLGNSPLVSQYHTRTMSVTGAQELDAQAGNPVTMSWDDTAAPVNLGGTMGAAIDTLTNVITKYSTALDAVAKQLADQVNAVHAAGFSPDGTTGLDFFTGTTAASIKVAITDPAQVAVSSALGTLNNSVADTMADMATLSGGADQTYQSLIGQLGVDAQAATRRSQIQNNVTDQVDAARSSESGVNLDEEMTNLLTYQRGYEAASRVLTTIDSMLDQLINRTGLVGR